MSRVYFDPDTGNWVHADTGNKISAWEVRNREPHVSEIASRGGGPGQLYSRNAERVSGPGTDPGTVDQNPGTVPIPPSNPQAEEEYVEELLAAGNYA